MDEESSFVRTSPLPDLARKQVVSLESVLARLESDAAERKSDVMRSSCRDRRMFALQLVTLMIATATLIAAIPTFIAALH